jgi:hypothetical protein
LAYSIRAVAVRQDLALSAQNVHVALIQGVYRPAGFFENDVHVRECNGVASAEIAAGPNDAPTRARPRSGRVANLYHGVFRRQLRAVAICLLLVNLALGLFARQQQHATIDHAIDIFDTAFISTNYVHLAQMSFQRYADDRLRAAGPEQIARANALLENVLDEMDVAIERSSSPRSRAQGLEIRANIAALPNVGIDAPDLTDRRQIFSNRWSSWPPEIPTLA